MQARGITHTGLVRDKNEDSFRIEKEIGLGVVADGMGGHKSGEVASAVAVDTFISETKRLLSASYEPMEILSEAFKKANSAVFELARKDESKSGMGTTLTAVLLLDKLYIAHVGDSRLYRWRNNSLNLLTEDHSYVAELVRNGSITSSEAFEHPQRNVLLKALGTEEHVVPDLIIENIEAHDILILCTDGLHSLISLQEMEGLMRRAAFDNDFLQKLLERCLALGAPDNLTVVLIKP